MSATLACPDILWKIKEASTGHPLLICHADLRCYLLVFAIEFGKLQIQNNITGFEPGGLGREYTSRYAPMYLEC